MFSQQIVQAIKDHAREQYPRESCGVVSAGEYVPCENVADTPEEHFKIDTDEYLKFLTGPGVEAIIHSHPNGPDCPTKDDMEHQEASAVPWGIVQVNEKTIGEPFFFGDQVPMPPLLGRVFRVNVTDCYGLVRDWFRMNSDIVLPFFPREPFWWEKPDQNILGDNFYEMGFREIPALEREGDCCLAKIRGPLENHCALYLGNGLVMHHLPNRLSRREPIVGWMKYVTRFFRHKDFEAKETK